MGSKQVLRAMTVQQRSGLRWMWLALAACASLAVAWWLGAAQQRRGQVQTEQRLEQIEARIAQQVSPPLRAARPVAADVVRGGAAAGSMQHSGMQDHARLLAERDWAIDRLDQRLASEGRDPAWSGKAEGAASEAMLAPAMRAFGMPESEQVRCARSLCRMVLTFTDASAAADWSDFYPLGIASVMPGMRSYPVTLPDGRVELRMYGFRGEATARTEGGLPEL